LILKFLRDAVYFDDYQHVRPIAVLAVWATALSAAWPVVARRRQAQPCHGLARYFLHHAEGPK
jgi:hypothetical protein